MSSLLEPAFLLELGAYAVAAAGIRLLKKRYRQQEHVPAVGASAADAEGPDRPVAGLGQASPLARPASPRHRSPTPSQLYDSHPSPCADFTVSDRLLGTAPNQHMHDDAAVFLDQAPFVAAPSESTPPKFRSFEASVPGNDKSQQSTQGCDPDRCCGSCDLAPEHGNAAEPGPGTHSCSILPCEASALACDPDQAYHDADRPPSQTASRALLGAPTQLGHFSQSALHQESVEQAASTAIARDGDPAPLSHARTPADPSPMLDHRDQALTGLDDQAQDLLLSHCSVPGAARQIPREKASAGLTHSPHLWAKPNTSLPSAYLPALPSLPPMALPSSQPSALSDASAHNMQLDCTSNPAANSKQAQSLASGTSKAATVAAMHLPHGIEDVHNPAHWDPLPGRDPHARPGSLWTLHLVTEPETALAGTAAVAESREAGMAEAAAASEAVCVAAPADLKAANTASRTEVAETAAAAATSSAVASGSLDAKVEEATAGPEGAEQAIADAEEAEEAGATPRVAAQANAMPEEAEGATGSVEGAGQARAGPEAAAGAGSFDEGLEGVLERRNVLLRIAADKKRKAADLEAAEEGAPWLELARRRAQTGWNKLELWQQHRQSSNRSPPNKLLNDMMLPTLQNKLELQQRRRQSSDLSSRHKLLDEVLRPTPAGQPAQATHMASTARPDFPCYPTRNEASNALMLVYHAALHSPQQAKQPDQVEVKRARLAMRRGLSPEEEDRGMLFLGHETFPSAILPEASPTAAQFFPEAGTGMLLSSSIPAPAPAVPAAEYIFSPLVADHGTAGCKGEMPQHAVWLGDSSATQHLPEECMMDDEAMQPACQLAAEAALPEKALQHESVLPDEAMGYDSEAPDEAMGEDSLAEAMQHESELPDEAPQAESGVPDEAMQQGIVAEPIPGACDPGQHVALHEQLASPTGANDDSSREANGDSAESGVNERRAASMWTQLRKHLWQTRNLQKAATRTAAASEPDDLPADLSPAQVAADDSPAASDSLPSPPGPPMDSEPPAGVPSPGPGYAANLPPKRALMPKHEEEEPAPPVQPGSPAVPLLPAEIGQSTEATDRGKDLPAEADSPAELALPAEMEPASEHGDKEPEQAPLAASHASSEEVLGDAMEQEPEEEEQGLAALHRGLFGASQAPPDAHSRPSVSGMLQVSGTAPPFSTDEEDVQMSPESDQGFDAAGALPHSSPQPCPDAPEPNALSAAPWSAAAMAAYLTYFEPLQPAAAAEAKSAAAEAKSAAVGSRAPDAKKPAGFAVTTEADTDVRPYSSQQRSHSPGAGLYRSRNRAFGMESPKGALHGVRTRPSTSLRLRRRGQYQPAASQDSNGLRASSPQAGCSSPQAGLSSPQAKYSSPQSYGYSPGRTPYRSLRSPSPDCPASRAHTPDSSPSADRSGPSADRSSPSADPSSPSAGRSSPSAGRNSPCPGSSSPSPSSDPGRPSTSPSPASPFDSPQSLDDYPCAPASSPTSPPSRGDSPLSKGHGPYSRGRSPPSRGYSPPSRGDSPPSGGCSPPRKGDSRSDRPPSRGDSPPSGGDSPSCRGYSPGYHSYSQAYSPVYKGCGSYPSSYRPPTPRSPAYSPAYKDCSPAPSPDRPPSPRSPAYSPVCQGYGPYPSPDRPPSPRSPAYSPVCQGYGPYPSPYRPPSPRSRAYSPVCKGNSPAPGSDSPQSPRSPTHSPVCQGYGPYPDPYRPPSPRSPAYSPVCKGYSPAREGYSPAPVPYSPSIPRSPAYSPGCEGYSPAPTPESPTGPPSTMGRGQPPHQSAWDEEDRERSSQDEDDREHSCPVCDEEEQRNLARRGSASLASTHPALPKTGWCEEEEQSMPSSANPQKGVQSPSLPWDDAAEEWQQEEELKPASGGESDEEEVQLVAERGPVELVAERNKFGHVTRSGLPWSVDLSKLKYYTGLGLEEEEEQIADPAVQASILATCKVDPAAVEEAKCGSEVDIMGEPESADGHRRRHRQTATAADRLADCYRHTSAHDVDIMGNPESDADSDRRSHRQTDTVDIMGDPESDADSGRRSNTRTDTAADRLVDCYGHTDAHARHTAKGLHEGSECMDMHTEIAMLGMLESLAQIDRQTAPKAVTGQHQGSLQMGPSGVNGDSDADKDQSPGDDYRRPSVSATAHGHDESAAVTDAQTHNNNAGVCEGRWKRICCRAEGRGQTWARQGLFGGNLGTWKGCRDSSRSPAEASPQRLRDRSVSPTAALSKHRVWSTSPSRPRLSREAPLEPRRQLQNVSRGPSPEPLGPQAVTPLSTVTPSRGRSPPPPTETPSRGTGPPPSSPAYTRQLCPDYEPFSSFVHAAWSNWDSTLPERSASPAQGSPHHHHHHRHCHQQQHNRHGRRRRHERHAEARAAAAQARATAAGAQARATAAAAEARATATAAAAQTRVAATAAADAGAGLLARLNSPVGLGEAGLQAAADTSMDDYFEDWI